MEMKEKEKEKGGKNKKGGMMVEKMVFYPCCETLFPEDARAFWEWWAKNHDPTLVSSTAAYERREWYGNVPPPQLPESEVKKRGKRITYLSKLGGIGLGYLINGKVYHSLGNGYYGVIEVKKYWEDNGRRYMEAVRSLGIYFVEPKKEG